MPSTASMILRASREAARAARSAASAASRCAAALAAAHARSGSRGAAASDRLMRGPACAAPIPRKRLSLRSGRSPVAARPSGSASSSNNGYGYGGGCFAGHSTVIPPPLDASPFLQKGRPKFEADEKDLESDEALFALYERWCKFYNEERSRDEMVRRFGKFKETVLRVEENKKAQLPYTLGINMFADGKLYELCSNKVPMRLSRDRQRALARRRAHWTQVLKSRINLHE